MKGLFITVFVVFFSFCTVRFIYGIDSFSFAYSFEYLSESLPDLKEDFEAFLLAYGDVYEAISSLGSTKLDFGSVGYIVGLSEILGGIYDILELSVLMMELPVSLARGFLFLVKDIFVFLRCIFDLLFLPIGNRYVP